MLAKYLEWLLCYHNTCVNKEGKRTFTSHHSHYMEFVVIQSFTNYIDAHILLGRLQEEGIQCWLKNEATVTIIPVWNNALGGIQVMVNKDEWQKAADILKIIQDEKRSKFICPQCGSHNVEYINTMRKPVNWLSTAITFLLDDYALMPEQCYHCFHCGAEFKEPVEATDN